MKPVAVLLLNMGGPDSLHAVRPFLFNLFSDRDIIRLGPSILQKPLAWFISNLRAGKSKKNYQSIGGYSPLQKITTAQASSLSMALGSDYKIYVGMRYWPPLIGEALQKIRRDGIRSIIVLSLYPQYSRATTGSSIKAFKDNIGENEFDVLYISSWYDFPPYIDCLVKLIKEELSHFKSNDADILFSAHSLPEYFIKEGDPYLEQTRTTIAEIQNKIHMKWYLSFQSRSGPVKWLEPSTEAMIKDLAQKGCQNLLAVPISFVSDHIETLYELDILYKQQAEGFGIHYRRCKALNTSEKFINVLKSLVILKMKRAGWRPESE